MIYAVTFALFGMNIAIKLSYIKSGWFTLKENSI